MALKVGVIGTGRIGALLEQDYLRKKPCTHLGAWQTLHCETYIAEPDEARRDMVSIFFRPSGVYEDYEKMLDEPKLDIVSVATPTETHSPIVRLIAEKEAAKLVFCEKPIAATLPDARDMISACANHGVKLAINHTRRWERAWQELRRTIARETYGSVIGSVAYYSGDIVNDGCHMADLLNWYRMKGGKFQVYNMKDNEYLIFELDVFFQRGRIRIVDNGRHVDNFQAGPSIWYDYVKELTPKASAQFFDVSSETPMMRACRQLADVVKGGGEPLCTGVDGLYALERALGWQAASKEEKEVLHA